VLRPITCINARGPKDSDLWFPILACPPNFYGASL
jgi:hypothetical protein